MLLRTSMAVFAAAISLSLWSETCAATELNVPPTASTDIDWWQKDLTVVAIAPDGTWGAETDPITGRAIANAMADCKNKYQSKIGCGSQMTFVRGGWTAPMAMVGSPNRVSMNSATTGHSGSSE